MKLTPQSKKIVQFCLDFFSEWNYYPKDCMAYRNLERDLYKRFGEWKE